MALPKEPRQKMINLMYLVLTALLALNVSAEILNAFKTVNTSLTNANGIIDGENRIIFSSFDSLLTDPKTHDRAITWKPRADSAQMLADNMYKYLESVKTQLIQASKPDGKGGYNEEELEATTRIMTEGTGGKDLLKKLTDYKDNLLGIATVKDKFGNELPIDLSIPPTKNVASKGDWSLAYFRMVPTVAAITILSKFENDVKNSESMVVNYCHEQVGAVKIVYDQYKALVGQTSNYLMPGQELTITAGIGSYSSASKPEITIDGQPVAIDPVTGVAQQKFNVGGPQSYTKQIHIRYFDQSKGGFQEIAQPITYTVGSPTGASVSADAVKVLYIGLQNPLTISGGNVGDEKVQASINNGTLAKQGNGKYVSEPATPGKATVHLVIVGGKPQDFEFRVKSVPDPVAVVGVNKGGRMRVNEFKAQFGVSALLDNFVFEGVKFNVIGYTIVLNGGRISPLQFRQVQGASFDPVRDLIEKAGPGTTITLDEIKASGPGGTRTLAPIVFNLY